MRIVGQPLQLGIGHVPIALALILRARGLEAEQLHSQQPLDAAQFVVQVLRRWTGTRRRTSQWSPRQSSDSQAEGWRRTTNDTARPPHHGSASIGRR